LRNTNRQIVFRETGGPLLLEEVHPGPPGPNEVKLRVEAIGLNRVEELFHSGSYFIKPSFPSKLGLEGSGVVEAVGEGVTDTWIKKRVSVLPTFEVGTYGVAGETVIVPVSSLVEIPKNVTFEQAASAWMAYLTSYGAIIYNGGVKRGDFVLINAASSSVGLAMIQTVKALGAISIGMTRTEAKRDALLELGADHVVVSTRGDVRGDVRAVTSNLGASVVFDPVAGKGVMELAGATADGGTIVIGGFLGTDMFGYADGLPTPFPFIDAVGRNLNIRGFSARGLMGDAPAMDQAKNYIASRLESGEFKPTIDKVFPLERIEEAYAYMRGGNQIGKIVVSAK
jgi:NADPH:quinone reductase-like Zn-dependent oxidoreductase